MPCRRFTRGKALNQTSGSAPEVPEHVGRLAGLTDEIAKAVHVIHRKTDTGVFIDAFPHCHVISGIALLVFMVVIVVFTGDDGAPGKTCGSKF